jgi:hypothetical protein
MIALEQNIRAPTLYFNYGICSVTLCDACSWEILCNVHIYYTVPTLSFLLFLPLCPPYLPLLPVPGYSWLSCQYYSYATSSWMYFDVGFQIWLCYLTSKLVSGEWAAICVIYCWWNLQVCAFSPFALFVVITYISDVIIIINSICIIILFYIFHLSLYLSCLIQLSPLSASKFPIFMLIYSLGPYFFLVIPLYSVMWFSRGFLFIAGVLALSFVTSVCPIYYYLVKFV